MLSHQTNPLFKYALSLKNYFWQHIALYINAIFTFAGHGLGQGAPGVFCPGEGVIHVYAELLPPGRLVNSI